MRMRPAATVTRLMLAAALAAGCAAPADRAPAAAADTTWVARSALYEVFVTDFSPEGNFAGVTAGLDHIAATGTDVVWLMPIHPIGVENRKGTLGSPYAGRDYRGINPAYGTADDFRALVEAVHARGMKLILDWVPNHTAWDHVWVTEHPDYYVRDSAGGLMVPRDPGGNPTDWTDVAELDYGNPALRDAMIEAMKYWLVEFGIDGFRVDVAGFVPYEFWREAVPALRAAAPRRILLLAEWGDLEMHRVGFDLTYAWDAFNRLEEAWRGGPASEFVAREVAELADMPPGGMRLRFTTNHDKTAWETPPLELFGGPAGARAAFVAMAFLPGRPLIYNGQAVESPQRLGLFERMPIAWNQPDSAAALAHYRRVVRLARTDSALVDGDFAAVETSAPADVIAYRRGDLVVLVNIRPRPVEVTVAGVAVDGARDLLTGRDHRGGTVALPAYGAAALRPGGGGE